MRPMLGGLVLAVLLMLAACCPAPEFAPGAPGVGTGVVGKVLAVEPGGALLELPGGERLVIHTDEALGVGSRVYVEGVLQGGALAAERVRRLG